MGQRNCLVVQLCLEPSLPDQLIAVFHLPILCSTSTWFYHPVGLEATEAVTLPYSAIHICIVWVCECSIHGASWPSVSLWILILPLLSYFLCAAFPSVCTAPVSFGPPISSYAHILISSWTYEVPVGFHILVLKAKEAVCDMEVQLFRGVCCVV